MRSLGAFAAGLSDPRLQASLDLENVLRELDGVGVIEATGRRPVPFLLERAARQVRGSGSERLLEGLAREADQLYSLAAQPDPNPVTIVPEAFVAEDDRVDYEFVMGAFQAARSLARLLVRSGERASVGTAWLMAEGLLMTNWHVLAAGDREASLDDIRARAATTKATFDVFSDNDVGTDAGPLRLRTASKELDYAVLEFSHHPDRRPLRVSTARAQKGSKVNIPQYGPGALRFALRENTVVSVDDARMRVHYMTDTEPGASGLPVCNDQWQVVALHRAAARVPGLRLGAREYTLHNEGVLIDAIMRNFAGT